LYFKKFGKKSFLNSFTSLLDEFEPNDNLDSNPNTIKKKKKKQFYKKKKKNKKNIKKISKKNPKTKKKKKKKTSWYSQWSR